MKTLSSKIFMPFGVEVIETKDVKDFIKKLKEELCMAVGGCYGEAKCNNCYKIDSLAGEHLIKLEGGEENENN